MECQVTAIFVMLAKMRTGMRRHVIFTEVFADLTGSEWNFASLFEVPK